MNEEENKDIIITNAIDQALKKLHSEIDFASKILNVKSDDYGNTLNTCIASFKSLLEKLEGTLEQNKQQSKMIIDEIAILTLLPEKITSNVTDVIPQIASEIDHIYNSNLKDTNQEIETLQNKLANAFGEYQQKLDVTTNKCIARLATTTENFSVTTEQKLSQFTNTLTKSSGSISTQNSKILFKTLAFVVIFSAIVSGITSYVVTTKFPKFVTITGANNLSVTNSSVDIWNKKNDLYIKERPNVKK